MNLGWREDLGEAIQELHRREPEGGASREVGPWQEVEDLVGPAIDEMETVEGEGRPRAVANQAFETSPVGGLGKGISKHLRGRKAIWERVGFGGRSERGLGIWGR